MFMPPLPKGQGADLGMIGAKARDHLCNPDLINIGKGNANLIRAQTAGLKHRAG